MARIPFLTPCLDPRKEKKVSHSKEVMEGEGLRKELLRL